MRKSLTAIVTTIALFALGATTLAAAEPAPEVATSPAGVININTADASQFALLPRVGEKAGARIVEYRKANGGFKKTSDLMQVKGIGEKTFETLRPYLAVDGKTTLSAKQHGPRKARAQHRTRAASASVPTPAAQ